MALLAWAFIVAILLNDKKIYEISGKHIDTVVDGWKQEKTC